MSTKRRTAIPGERARTRVCLGRCPHCALDEAVHGKTLQPVGFPDLGIIEMKQLYSCGRCGLDFEVTYRPARVVLEPSTRRTRR